MDGRILAVDIGKAAVCAVLLAPRNGGLGVETSVRASVRDGSLLNALGEAVDLLKQRTDISGAFCIASFPDAQVFYRLVSMPFSDSRKIGKVIAYETEPLLPFSADELFFDFTVVDGLPAGKGSGATVLVCAVEKRKLSELIEQFSSVGLEPDVIVPRGWAMARVLAGHDPETLLVAKDGEEVTVLIVSGGQVRFARVFRVPASFENGDEKHLHLCAGLRQTVLSCEEDTGLEIDPAVVHVACEDADAESFKQAVAECFGKETRNLDVPGYPTVAGSGGNGVGPALAIGLLARAGKPVLNFRKGEFSLTGRWMKYWSIFGKSFAIAGVVAILGLADFFCHMHMLKKEISLVDAQRRAVFSACFPDSHAEPSSDMMRYEIDRLKKAGGFSAGMDRGFYLIDVLNDISRLIPSDLDVNITRFVAGADDVVISGDTDSFRSVDTIKNNLGKSGLFRDIVISSATMDRSDNRVHFKLQAGFKS